MPIPSRKQSYGRLQEGSLDQQKRDEAWGMLADLCTIPQLFVRRPRGLIVRGIMERHGVTNQTVYRLLRRYWQRGMCRNALLPDYVNSGARGKRRKPNQAKLGRPRVVMEGKGSNVTPDIERIFRRVIEERLLKEKHPSIPDAYAAGLNLLRAVLTELPTSELPTLGQFRYFYGREYHFTDTLPCRVSAVDFAKDFRPLSSTSTTEALGPGYRYQIDATIADIYLVSEHDRSLIVGRPVVYMVIDVFSRMVVGMYVGFEGPSWVSAMVALANTVADKVEYCRQYSVEIDASDWPVKGLPDVVLADKGRTEWHQGGSIFPSLRRSHRECTGQARRCQGDRRALFPDGAGAFQALCQRCGRGHHQPEAGWPRLQT